MLEEKQSRDRIKESAVRAACLNRVVREGFSEMVTPKKVMGRAMQVADVRAFQADGTAHAKP